MKAWHPEEEDIIEFLQIVTNPEIRPFSSTANTVPIAPAPCAPSTGLSCRDGRRPKPLMKMRCGGFGFHKMWEDLAAWINRLNLEEIRTKAGINTVLYTGPEPASICR